LSNRSVSFTEVWGEENIEEGTSKAFDCVGNRKDSDTLGLVLVNSVAGQKLGVTYIFDIRARVNSDHITMLDSQVMSDDTIHPSATIIELLIRKYDQNSVLTLLALNENSITSEEL